MPVWPEGFGENGVRGGENSGSEKASGVCVASAEFRGATALCLKRNLSGTPVDKVKEGRRTGDASCGVQTASVLRRSVWEAQTGGYRGEGAGEQRRAKGSSAPPPAGHPSEAGEGETRPVGWDRSVHSGVSWGDRQVQKTGRADRREGRPLALLWGPGHCCACRRRPPLPRDAYRMAPAYLGRRVRPAPSRSG